MSYHLLQAVRMKLHLGLLRWKQH